MDFEKERQAIDIQSKILKISININRKRQAIQGQLQETGSKE